MEWVDTMIENSIQCPVNKLKCKHCLVMFSSQGNLHKHYKTARICNNLAKEDFINCIVADKTFLKE